MWHAMVRGVRQPERLEGLQRQQFWVLGALTCGPCRMSELAERAQTSQTSLTGIVDRLEERGLVERVRNESDRRVVEVALTAEGREQMASGQRAMVRRLEDLLLPLSPDDRTELLRLVRLITAKQARPDHPCGPPTP